MLIIGSHVSFKSDDQLVGSVKESLSYGSNTFMFYTGAPQNTMRKPINGKYTMDAYNLMYKSGIDPVNLIVHAPYIINLANRDNFSFNVSFLTEEIESGVFRIYENRNQNYGGIIIWHFLTAQ